MGRRCDTQASSRRQLHDELVEMRGAIRCVARVRPLHEGDDPESMGPSVRQIYGPGKLAQPCLACYDSSGDRFFEMDSILDAQVGCRQRMQVPTYGTRWPLGALLRRANTVDRRERVHNMIKI